MIFLDVVRGGVEKNYGHQIKKTVKSMNISCEILLENVRKYYDGFSFNGEIKVYNQFF